MSAYDNAEPVGVNSHLGYDSIVSGKPLPDLGA
jgi:hypothetical protein